MPGCRSPWTLEDDHFGGRSHHFGNSCPMILDGATDGEMFTAGVAHVLLKERRPGDGVVIDNLPAHKVAAVRQIIEAADPHLLYLPPCSPHFNPIEKAFSQIKACLKKKADRTKESLDNAITNAIDGGSPKQATDYFAACGYQSDTA